MESELLTLQDISHIPIGTLQDFLRKQAHVPAELRFHVWKV